MTKHTIIAAVVGIVGVLALVGTLSSSGSVRSYVADNYRFVGTQKVQGGTSPSKVYASRDPVVKTAHDIADARKPADRRTTPSGVILRYQNDAVAVLPNAKGGGSRVLVDDEATGYHHYFPYVGGWWGTYSGPAEQFRGGGPGAGK
jgi:uncharacterized protein DUF4247